MKLVKYSLITAASIMAVGGLSVTALLYKYSKELPTLDAMKNYTPNLVTTIFSSDDKIIAEFSSERRKTLSVEEMPQVVIDAFIAAEDNEFFTHKGINPFTILRAAIKNLQAGHTVQGGSTITQQVAKQILLSPEKSYARKIKEMLLAFRIEKEFTKKEIITLYLNHIFLGMQAYGVEAAAYTYFGKPAKELTVPEAAILAGLPKAPSQDNPVKDPKAARGRQRYVLGRMLATGMITRAEYENYLIEPLKIANRQDWEMYPAPYFTENVRRYLKAKYGDEMLYGGGLKVYTTLSLPDQTAAQDAIKTGLISLDKRIGMRAPSTHIDTAEARDQYLTKQHKDLLLAANSYRILTESGELETPAKKEEPTPIDRSKNYSALVIGKGSSKEKTIKIQIGNRQGVILPEDYKWVFDANPEEIYKDKTIRNPFTQLKVGDLITVQLKAEKKPFDEFFLEQEPMVQGALLSYRVSDGALLAMVGGYDYYVTRSEFNRATQARRQPGSTFKPLVFAAALDQGLTPSTILVDSPIVYKDTNEQTQMEKVWKPDNASDKFYGDTTLRQALAFSRNIPTIKLLQHIKVDTVVEYAKKLGIKSNLNADLSLALGSSGVTLEELTKAFGVFANSGKRLNTYSIRKIVDRNGVILEEYKAPETEQVIPEPTAFLITSMLKSVIDYGTGTLVKALGMPVAGKTGTTNDSKDALFVGYTPEIVAGVWTGFDEQTPIGRNETGSKAAAPIWLQYMQVATANSEKKDFPIPNGIIQMQVDAETGDVPSPRTQKRISEYFIQGTAPGQMPGILGPDGQFTATGTEPNRTQVVTGNTGVLPKSGTDPDSEVKADELMREDL